MSLASAIGASPRQVPPEQKFVQFVETLGLLPHESAVRGQLCRPCDGSAPGARRATTLCEFAAREKRSPNLRRSALLHHASSSQAAAASVSVLPGHRRSEYTTLAHM